MTSIPTAPTRADFAAILMAGVLLLPSCQLPDGEIAKYGPYRVKDLYECTEPVALTGIGTEHARLMSTSDYARATSFEAFAGRPPPALQVIPPGTRFELISIYRRNQSSWNNGLSYAYRSTVRIMTGSFSNQTARADGLFLLLEGRGGQPVETPLRLVERPD